MNLVVDCSFIMSSILPDELSLKTREIYNNISDKIYTIYVPSIFFLECNNVLISALKKQRISNNDYEEFLQILNQLPIITDKFSSTAESLYSIGRIASSYGLTSYDASYLELAIRIDAKIATLDKTLANSSKQANITSLII